MIILQALVVQCKEALAVQCKKVTPLQMCTEIHADISSPLFLQGKSSSFPSSLVYLIGTIYRLFEITASKERKALMVNVYGNPKSTAKESLGIPISIA